MNYRSDRDTKLDILLNKISIASRHFVIKELLGQVDSHDLSPSPIESSYGSTGNQVSSLKIGWQERVTLHYLVVPIVETSSTAVTFSTLSFSSGNKGISQSLLPQIGSAQVTDFMCRERAHDMFRVSRHEWRRR